MMADIFTAVESSDFWKFVFGALVAGSVFLLVRKISEALTSTLVKKDELKVEFDLFKKSLIAEIVTAELVTQKDMRLFKTENALEMERAMKDMRHALKNEVQSSVLATNELAAKLTGQMAEIKIAIARMEEHQLAQKQ